MTTREQTEIYMQRLVKIIDRMEQLSKEGELAYRLAKKHSQAMEEASEPKLYDAWAFYGAKARAAEIVQEMHRLSDEADVLILMID